MLSLDNFESQINATIVQRGRDYFKQQTVESLEEHPRGVWTAVVEGRDDYEVIVNLAGKYIGKTSCDCPYDGGGVCKHIVAVLFALRERSSLPAKKSAKPAKLSFEDLLLKVNLEEMRDFVRQQKTRDREFGEKFMLFFAEKDPNLDVSAKYEGLVRQIVRKHSSKGFMEYRQTFSFEKEIQQVLDAADTAIERKNFREAFAIGKLLCHEVLQLIQASDDSAGNIGGVLSSAIQIFDNLAAAPTLSPELCDSIFEHLLKMLEDKDWFSYGDFGYELLRATEKIAPRTKPERYLNLLDSLLKIHADKHSDFFQDYFKKLKIQFLESMGRQEEAEKLVAASMDVVEIREGVVQKALQKKEFLKAKQLVREGIELAEAKGHPGTVSNWEKMLLEIAYLENERGAIQHFTKKFAFDRGLNVEFYQKWKATFSPEEWQRVIESHIQSVVETEKKAPKSHWSNLEESLFLRLSPIFIQEKMWQRLLELIPPSPSEHTLAAVHPHLATLFPQQLLGFYLQVLSELGDRASQRSEYSHLADLMLKVKRDIENSAVAIDNLAAALILKFPRRPAMLDELRRVGEKK